MRTRAVVIPRFGGPEVLELREVELPRPRRGQVRVRVQASGVAYGDLMRRRGVLAPLRRPFTPGYDVAGVVEALGPGVDPSWRGARVAAMMPTPGIGGYAEHVRLPASRLARVPDAVPFDEAVCLSLNYITAHQLLHRFARVRRGDRILVHGAAGGVGTALLQLAARLDLDVHGTASAKKHALVRSLGARPIDYRAEDFVEVIRERTGGEGVAAVFDGIGGAHLRRSHAVLARGGTLVSFGVSGERGLGGIARTLGHFVSLALRPDGRRVRFYAITATPGAFPAQCRDDFEALLGMRARGEVAPVVAARLPLERADEAHRMLETSAVMGKVVLTREAAPA